MALERHKIEARVAARFAAQQTGVPPDFKGDPQTHGIENPRGGGFSIMQNLQEDLHKESEKEAEEGADVQASVARRVAMYWCAPERTYRLTKGEQGGGDIACPKCRQAMDKESFTRSEKMYRCSHCGFKIGTGKTVTKKIEIEIDPDGEIDVEITAGLKSRRNNITSETSFGFTE
jgi:predicted RNA-binding Zn-ribbon protein involved in translation (DUF1610 family)